MDSALHQLAARMDGQGFEARVIDSRLFVIAPPTVPWDGSRLIDVIAATSTPDEHGRIWYNGEPRNTVIITCKPREDDGGTPWFFAGDRPVIEAANIIDAAVLIGGPLMRAKAGR
jgi:hypothetical protein